MCETTKEAIFPRKRESKDERGRVEQIWQHKFRPTEGPVSFVKS